MSEYLVSQLSKLLGKNEYLFVYDVIEFLGWLNILLTLIALSLFLLRRLNRHLLNNKNQFIKKIQKPLSKIHPFIGIALLVFAYLHGDLALGSLFRIHTGPLAWFLLLAMLLLGTVGKKYRVKNWLKFHRGRAAFFVLSIFLHLFFRNLLG
jgi:hypothetical protein